MIAAPPSEVGARQDRVTWALPAVAVSPVGGPGFSTRACGPCMAVRTTDTPGPGGAVTPLPASIAGQPARTAARHVPASVVSHRRPGAAARVRQAAGGPGATPGRGLLARRKGFMRTPAGVATRCHED